MTDAETIQFLAGEVNGLRACIFALFKTHPNRRELAQEFERLIEVQLAMVNPTPVSEHYLDGQGQTVDELNKYLRALNAP
jgi:hypothetical protein